MKQSSRRSCYPLDIDAIAHDVVDMGIDIAPTRLAWERLAQCLATNCGEQGRDAFHLMAAVWPCYSRHDSEMCYSRALRLTGKPVGMGYLVNTLKRHGIDTDNHRYRKAGKPQLITTKETPNNNKTMKKIAFNTLNKTQPQDRALLGRNQLTDLLLRIFPQPRVMTALKRYLVGFNSFNTGKLGDALIFWQIDEQRNIVNAKRIHYGFDGHRNKQYPPLVMYPGNPQCLFGLHLLRDASPDKPVAIVESEKSALVMSMTRPEYLWMACGSLNNFNERFLEPLRQRFVIGFPDLDSKRDKATGVSMSCALWQKTAKQLRLQGWRIIIDTALEENATTAQRLAKLDVADVAIEQAKRQQLQRLKK